MTVNWKLKFWTVLNPELLAVCVFGRTEPYPFVMRSATGHPSTMYYPPPHHPYFQQPADVGSRGAFRPTRPGVWPSWSQTMNEYVYMLLSLTDNYAVSNVVLAVKCCWCVLPSITMWQRCTMAVLILCAVPLAAVNYRDLLVSAFEWSYFVYVELLWHSANSLYRNMWSSIKINT